MSRMQWPGSACQGASLSGSLRVNSSGSTSTVWCPMMATFVPNSFIAPENVWVDLSHGWATTSSCMIYEAASTNTFWLHAPNSLANNGSYDTAYWSLGSGVNEPWGMEVECYLPPGQVLFDYQFREEIIFDWVSW